MMEIPVLVEPVANNGFRAISGGPLPLETEAPTREEAIHKLRQLIELRVAAGAEVVAVSIGNSTHPLAAYAGMLKDDPSVESWKQAMSDYRQERDAGPDTP
jgi:sugar phosphate isomerase/epimerase